MIAAFPMYDWPELRPQTDAFWQLVRDALKLNGIDAPEGLTRGPSQSDLWLSPDLLVAQTCGYPLATVLQGRVRVVAAPHYDVQGCGPARYSSALLLRVEHTAQILSDTRHKRLAYNSLDSLSGYRCLVPELGDPSQWFDTLIESGSHRQSARMVVDGAADIAAVDALCWHYFQRYEPDYAAQLRVLDWTQVMPALPFVTRLTASDREIQHLEQALNMASQSKVGQHLGFASVVPVLAADYAHLATL